MKINHKYSIHFFLIAFLALHGCKSGSTNNADQPIKDTIITSFDVKSNFILDSLFFDSLVIAHPELASYTEQARRFYSIREWSYAWFKDDGLREHAGFLFQFLQSGNHCFGIIKHFIQRLLGGHRLHAAQFQLGRDFFHFGPSQHLEHSDVHPPDVKLVGLH